MKPVVLVTGILDTKGAELRYISEQIRESGCDTLIMELSLGREVGEPWIDIPLGKVLEVIGKTPEDIYKKSRNDAGELVSQAGILVAKKLQLEGRINGIISYCGSMGSAITSAVMRELPYGFPKHLLSTSLHNYENYVQFKDMMVMYPLSECGFNVISKKIMSTAAGAIAGAAKMNAGFSNEIDTNKLVPVTMQGVTTPCGQRAYNIVNSWPGYESMIIHCTGAGGLSIEAMAREKAFAGLLDLNIAELGNNKLGGKSNSGPGRLVQAAANGIPQVIGTGSLDFVTFGGGDHDVPQKYMDEVARKIEGRVYSRHNVNVSIISTTVEECRELARELAEKISCASAPTAALIPLRGSSGYEMESPDIRKGWAGPGAAPCWLPYDGHPHWSKRSVNFMEELCADLPGDNGNIKVFACDMHINDPEYADTAAEMIRRMIDGDGDPYELDSAKISEVF